MRLIALVLLLLPLGTAFALVTDLNPRPTSPFAKPAYLSWGTEPDFGTRIWRVSGDPGTAIPTAGGSWSDLVMHNYPKDPVWSADQQLIVLKHASNAQGNALFLDGTTYKVLFGRYTIGSEQRWHPSLPDIMVYVASSGAVGHWNVRTNATTVKSAPSGYSGAMMGPYEGNVSYDGRWVVVNATRSSDGHGVAYAVDIDNGVKYPDIDLGAAGVGGLDWASISASGKYVVLHGSIGGVGQSSKIYDRNGNFIAFWTDYIFGHYDLGLNDAGIDIAFGAVAGAPSSKCFVARRLDTSAVTVLSGPTTYDWHASCRNNKRPGWGYAVTNDVKGTVYDKTIYAIKLDGSGAIERYAHTRTNQTDYWASAMPTPSPDGKRIMFASNWDASSGRPVQSFVIETGISAPTPQPPIAKIGATPTSGTAPLAVSFTSAGSSDPDGSIASYAWNFGDGTSGSGATISHTYTAAGSFTATLTVTDNSGLSASAATTISASAAPANGLQQGGFETPYVGAGGYVYNPSGSAWTFSGSSGLTGNGSGFTSGNPSSPEGVQVAFVQTTGVVSQTTNLGAGTFKLTFRAAQRGNWQASWQVVRVLIDAQGVGDFRPSTTGYEACSSLAFTIAAGAHTIRFVGLNPNGGDNTAFIDQVAIVASGGGGGGDTSLLASWKLDDGSGTIAADSSGIGNNGTLINGPAWTAGKIGGALNFDGVNDYVSVADNAGLRLIGDCTIALWFKKNAEAADWQRLVGKGNPTQRNFGLWEEAGAGKRLLFQQYAADGTPILNLFTANAFEVGTWYHVACVVSGNSVAIYVNGALDASGTRSGTPGTSADPLTLGFAGYHTYFPGALDDVRIYNRALAGSEIAGLTAAAPTNLAKNPGFEADNAQVQTISAWSTWGGASGTGGDADFTETGSASAPWRNAHSGTYHGTHWKGSAYEVYTYQVITGLASGTYRMTAWVKSGGGQSSTWMGAMNSSGVRSTAAIPSSPDTWVQLSVTAQVSNGQCEIGFYSNAGADQWIYFDDVQVVLVTPTANG